MILNLGSDGIRLSKTAVGYANMNEEFKKFAENVVSISGKGGHEDRKGERQ